MDDPLSTLSRDRLRRILSQNRELDHLEVVAGVADTNAFQSIMENLVEISSGRKAGAKISDEIASARLLIDRVLPALQRIEELDRARRIQQARERQREGI